MYKSTTKEEATMLRQALAKGERINVRSKVGSNPTYIIRPDELTDEEKNAVFGAVYFVGLSAFVQNPSKEMEEDIAEHLFQERYCLKYSGLSL